MNDQDCIIQSVPPVNITCSVFGYYPSIKLYFRQNSDILDNVRSAEWNNTDGTRNKAVTITVVSSDVPYTCVTSDIPGLDGQQRETTVVLAAAEEAAESTTQHISTESATENVTNRARLISKIFPIVLLQPGCSLQHCHVMSQYSLPQLLLCYSMIYPKTNEFSSYLTFKILLYLARIPYTGGPPPKKQQQRTAHVTPI